jgi:hypothetical protein
MRSTVPKKRDQASQPKKAVERCRAVGAAVGSLTSAGPRVTVCDSFRAPLYETRKALLPWRPSIAAVLDPPGRRFGRACRIRNLRRQNRPSTRLVRPALGEIRVPSRVLELPLSRSTDRLRRAPPPPSAFWPVGADCSLVHSRERPRARCSRDDGPTVISSRRSRSRLRVRAWSKGIHLRTPSRPIRGCIPGLNDGSQPNG